MRDVSAISANREAYRVTLEGMGINVLLFLGKILGGVLTGSIALIADGFHSLSDLATDGIALIGTRLGSRPRDRSHPYGHGKFETAAALFVALILLGIGGGILLSSVRRLRSGGDTPASFPVIAVAAISVLSKEWIFRRTRIVARRLDSPALYANAWHHRSDAFSSLAVIAGILAAWLGWRPGDGAAAFAVGCLITWVAIQIGYRTLADLTETAVDGRTLERVRKIVEKGRPEVREWHNLRSRRVGREVFLDLHVLVDPKISVEEGHRIASSVETSIRRELGRPANVMVHIEPDLESERKPREPLV